MFAPLASTATASFDVDHPALIETPAAINTCEPMTVY